MDHHDEDFLRRAAEARKRVTQIAPEDVDAWISAGVVVLDVREPDEYEKGTVPGARNVPIGTLAESIHSAVPDKSSPLVCFCNGGNRGSMAAAQLLDLGYSDVQSIAGGLRAYVARRQGR